MMQSFLNSPLASALHPEIFWPKFLEQLFIANNLKEKLLYLPSHAGKLVRPKIIFDLAQEKNLWLGNEKAWQQLAFAIELHHCYTLLHDDLPCMDNATTRRGFPTLHLSTNESTAVLVGDALLIQSIQALNELGLPLLNKIFLWCTGSKGLIRGQFDDLALLQNFATKQSPFPQISINEYLRMIELKTARLFQFSCLAFSLYEKYLYNPHLPLVLTREEVYFWKLGEWMGKVFQVIDDFEDQHQQSEGINLFLNFPADVSRVVDHLQQGFIFLKIKLNCKIPQFLKTLEDDLYAKLVQVK